MALPDYCSVFLAEATAIKLSIEYAIHKNLQSSFGNFQIFSDSRAATSAIISPLKHSNAVAETSTLLDQITIPCYLHWCKGHNDVSGNVAVDFLAREASRTGPMTNVSCPFSHIKRLVSHRPNLIWDNSWRACQKGSVTKIFFPSVLNTTDTITHLERPFAMTQVLSGHNFLNYYRYKLKFIGSSSHCKCDFPTEDTLHFLLDCPLYNSIRSDLQCAFSFIFNTLIV